MTNLTYLKKYARTGDTWQPWTSPVTPDQARSTIKAIRKRQDVSIFELESVISLTEHPNALIMLNSPPLIQECILKLHRQQNIESLHVSTFNAHVDIRA